MKYKNNHLSCREDELVKRASSLVVNSGMASDADLGPVISKQVNHLLFYQRKGC